MFYELGVTSAARSERSVPEAGARQGEAQKQVVMLRISTEAFLC